MNEILKYTFVKDTIEVRDGELTIGDPKEITAYFTMKISGISLFEREYGKPLLKTLTDILSRMDGESLKQLQTYADTGEGIAEDRIAMMIGLSDGLLDSKFVRALAGASYTKIEGNMPLNTIATMQEFKESEMYDLCLGDYEFIGKLLSMAVDCINAKNKKRSQQQGKRKN